MLKTMPLAILYFAVAREKMLNGIFLFCRVECKIESCLYNID
jgi:hypothetical protein